MARVFISYSRMDAEAALIFADRLRDSGFDIWLDQRDIPVSVPWLEEIEAAIRGSAVVVVVDSDRWRSSENCRAEAEIAEQWRVPAVHIAADAKPAEVLGSVAGLLDQRTVDDERRTELFVRAGDWATRGRPPGALVSGRTLRHYARAVRVLSPRIPAVVSAFLGACRRRQRRRTALRRIGLLTAIVLVVGGLIAYNAFGLVNSGIDKAITSMDISARYDALHARNPYAFAQYVAQADNAGWLTDYQFTRVFSDPVPIAVVPVDAPQGAAAVPPTQVGVLSALSPDGTLRAELRDGSSIVVVEATSGAVHRVLTASARPTTLAWSPAGDRLGVAEGADVELLDVAHGYRNQLLRGSVGDIRGLSMTDTAINALTDHHTVSWPAPWSTIAARDLGWIMAAAAVGTTGSTALLERSGVLIQLDTATGAQRDRIDTTITAPTVASALAVDPGGRYVAVTGLSDGSGPALKVIDLATHQVTGYDPDGCVPLDVTFSGPDALVLACGDAGIAVVDRQTHQVRPHAQGTFISSVAAAGGRLVAGTRLGAIMELDAHFDVSGTGRTRCAESITTMRFTPDGRYLFHGGTAAGTIGCDIRGNFGDGGARWDYLIFPDQDAQTSRAVAVSPNGQLVAFGFADGVVRVYGTDLIQPVLRLQPFTGEVRGLVFGADGRSLLIAGRDGDVAVTPVEPVVASLRDKQQRATALADKATELGLYRR